MSTTQADIDAIEAAADRDAATTESASEQTER